MLRIDSSLRTELLAQPESGMGYQIVEATSFNGRIQRGVAYNAELLLFEGEPRPMFRTIAFARLVNEAKPSAEIISLRVVAHMASTSSAFALKETATSYGRKAPPTKDAPIEKTKDKEVFKRFTAYENDHRIKPDGSLLPGTYATTEEDAKNVRTGKEAVARYALPNPKPASNVFTIKPHKDTLIQRGMVEPANDQPGGGAEVIFTAGTQPGTVTGPDKIPDE
jgi:hypothetical protein